jgi:hypothetical protein
VGNVKVVLVLPPARIAKPSRETIHDFERRPGRAWSWNEDVSFCGDVAQWCVFVPLCLCSGNPLVLVL